MEYKIDFTYKISKEPVKKYELGTSVTYHFFSIDNKIRLAYNIMQV